MIIRVCTLSRARAAPGSTPAVYDPPFCMLANAVKGEIARVKRACWGNGCYILLVVFGLIFVAGVGLVVFATNILKQAAHGLSKGYYRAQCSANMSSGESKRYCISKGCTLAMKCCDYGVAIYPELVDRKEVRSLFDRNANIRAALAKRSCQTQNPCEIYRRKLSLKEQWSATVFPCRFSPEKIKNPSAARDFCLQPNVDTDYFGSCAVVTEPEFRLLLEADFRRQHNKPFYRGVLASGVGILTFAAMCVGTVLCIQSRSHEQDDEPAGERLKRD